MKQRIRRVFASCLFGLWGLAPMAASALTPDQVVALKKAGIGEETIRLMIQQEEQVRKSPEETIGRREIKDEQGNTVILYSTGRSSAASKNEEEQKKAENAWKMLQNLMIDGHVK